MNVYELIQHLAKFPADAEVKVTDKDGIGGLHNLVYVGHGYGVILLRTDEHGE